MKPRMYYFGPWDRSGHYFFNEFGHYENEYKIKDFPFGHDGERISVDGKLQPGCISGQNQFKRSRPEVVGEASLHHINGWTALCFWDRSVDKRLACNSNYFAEGCFTFEEMVEMSKTRFAERWNKMQFEVKLVSDDKG